ncbi:MAG: DUF2177 family protein [Alphaproteobacteria bacterium]|nr:DUF2177 family protein [Alphaproteobacteria bacterium]
MALKFGGIYLAALVAFLIIDGIWLGVVARGFYADQLGQLLRPSPNWGVAGLFYVFYVVGVVVFAVMPAHNNESWVMAIGYGALLGLIAYGTYDLTNLATIRDWPVAMSIVDMIWGGVLTATVSFVGYMAARILLA